MLKASIAHSITMEYLECPPSLEQVWIEIEEAVRTSRNFCVEISIPKQYSEAIRKELKKQGYNFPQGLSGHMGYIGSICEQCNPYEIDLLRFNWLKDPD